MDIDNIKMVLDSGECPECQAVVVSDEDMTTYYCEQNREHFELKVTFHGGEKIIYWQKELSWNYSFNLSHFWKWVNESYASLSLNSENQIYDERPES